MSSDSIFDLSGLDDLFAALSDKQQAKARYEIAKYLRKTMRRRLTDQEDVHDNPFEPRQREKYQYDNRISADKPLFMRKRKLKMLLGFRDQAYLNIEQTDDSVSVGYNGRAGRLARVHNLGLRDRVGKRGGGYQWAQYPARQWIGINDRDEDAIRDILRGMLSGE